MGVEPNGFRRFFVVEKDVEMFLEACELKGLRRYFFGEDGRADSEVDQV